MKGESSQLTYKSIDIDVIEESLRGPLPYCRLVEQGKLTKEQVAGFFVFVVDKDSPSAGIAGHRVMKIMDARLLVNDKGMGSRGQLDVVAGEEPVKTVNIEDVSNEKPDCKEVGQWVSAGGVIDLEGVEVLKAKRANLQRH